MPLLLALAASFFLLSPAQAWVDREPVLREMGRADAAAHSCRQQLKAQAQSHQAAELCTRVAQSRLAPVEQQLLKAKGKTLPQPRATAAASAANASGT
ncbi:hypothetical protein DBR47_17010 [Paucibacter sp. KBW04]|nr:hypothetical protein DBR47_17010 [Paucibacter sp. KBW04]